MQSNLSATNLISFTYILFLNVKPLLQPSVEDGSSISWEQWGEL